MRRASYLAQIVGGVATSGAAKKRQATLSPPRLLFRPSPVTAELDLEAVSESARARSDNRVGVGKAGPARLGADPLPVPTRPRWEFHRPLSESTPEDQPTAESRLPAREPVAGALTSTISPRDTRAQPLAIGTAPSRSSTAAPEEPLTGVRALRPPEKAMGEPVRTPLHPSTQVADPKEPVQGPTRAAVGTPIGSQQLTPSKALKLPASESATHTDAPPPPPRALSPKLTKPVESARQTATTTARAPLLPKETRRAAPQRNDGAHRGQQVHIGTLEVRIVPPAPAPPRQAAPTASVARRTSAGTTSRAPLARGFGIFGFQQS